MAGFRRAGFEKDLSLLQSPRTIAGCAIGQSEIASAFEAICACRLPLLRVLAGFRAHDAAIAGVF